MTISLSTRHVRTLGLILAAAVLAAAGFAVNSQRSTSSNAGAATGGVHIFMKVTGQKTGVFKGDSAAKGQQDQIVVSGYQFELDSPRDAATGQPTGRRQYKPITVTHELDGASPEFIASCSTNEVLKTVVLNFYKTDRTGREVNFYRVTLTNATISSVRHYSSGSTVLEDDSFTFQKIEQDNLVAKTTVIDDWEVNLS